VTKCSPRRSRDWSAVVTAAVNFRHAGMVVERFGRPMMSRLPNRRVADLVADTDIGMTAN